MKAYGKNLRWISDHQWGEDYHTGICIPSSGHNRGERRHRYERSFKKAERADAKHKIRRELREITA